MLSRRCQTVKYYPRVSELSAQVILSEIGTDMGLAMSSDREILALEDERYAAMCSGDFAGLEAMLHDELL